MSRVFADDDDDAPDTGTGSSISATLWQRGLCLAPQTSPEFKTYRSIKLCRKCWLGVRAKKRTFEGNAEQRKADNALFDGDFDVWRDDTLPFCEPARERRPIVRAAKCQNTQYEASEDYSGNEGICDEVHYMKEQWKDYRGMARHLGQDEASEGWGDLYADKPRQNTHHQPTITLNAPEKSRTIKGKKEAPRTQACLGRR